MCVHLKVNGNQIQDKDQVVVGTSYHTHFTSLPFASAQVLAVTQHHVESTHVHIDTLAFMLDGAIEGLHAAFFLMSSCSKSSTYKHLRGSVWKTHSQSYQSGLSTFIDADIHTQLGTVKSGTAIGSAEKSTSTSCMEAGNVTWQLISFNLILGRWINFSEKASERLILDKSTVPHATGHHDHIFHLEKCLNPFLSPLPCSFYPGFPLCHLLPIS